MSKAATAIIDILTACGCKPAAMVNNNGDIIIKVNAPEIKRKEINKN
jgi:hypothetical protein